MGGIPFTLVGSRQQLPPVVTHGGRADVVQASPASMPEIAHATHQEAMTKSVRMFDKKYEKFVDKAGTTPGFIKLPKWAQKVESEEELLEFAFPCWKEVLCKKRFSFQDGECIRAAKEVADAGCMFPHHEEAVKWSEVFIRKMKGPVPPPAIANMRLKIEEAPHGYYLNPDHLLTLSCGSVPPPSLLLKTGAVYFFSFNYSRELTKYGVSFFLARFSHQRTLSII